MLLAALRPGEKIVLFPARQAGPARARDKNSRTLPERTTSNRYSWGRGNRIERPLEVVEHGGVEKICRHLLRSSTSTRTPSAKLFDPEMRGLEEGHAANIQMVSGTDTMPATQKPRRTRMAIPLLQSEIPGLPCRRGKVRDVYDLGDRLVIVATDRISAFDWVLPSGIPDKGRILYAVDAVLARFSQGRRIISSAPMSRRWAPRLPAQAKASARPVDAGAQGGGGAVRVRGARLSRRLRLEGISQAEHGVRHSAAGGIAGMPAASASRSSRRPPRRKAGTTRTSPSRRWRARPARSSPTS